MTRARYYWKVGDTGPTATATLQGSAGAADLTAATIQFIMRARDDAASVKVNGAATVVDENAGTVYYDRTAADTDTPGRYYAEFEVTYSNGDQQTFPEDDWIEVLVTDQLGSAP